MQTLFLRHAVAPAAAGITLLLLLVAALAAVDGFAPAVLPAWFESDRELLGTNLLLVLVPSYLVVAWGYGLRRSASLLRVLDAVLDDRTGDPRTPLRWLAVGAGLGAVYGAIFNLPGGSLRILFEPDGLARVLVLGMIFLWTSVGTVLASRLYVARLFVAAGRRVPIDPYEQSSLEPFARAGLVDVLLVVGALVLATLQSIDAQFRPENYLYALFVAVPAGTALLLWPMSSVHGRLKALRARELDAVNQLIRTAPKTLDAQAVAALERLLRRRDRVREYPVWPLNLAIVSRLMIYGVIPPAAWVAGALVEQWVEGLVGG